MKKHTTDQITEVIADGIARGLTPEQIATGVHLPLALTEHDTDQRKAGAHEALHLAADLIAPDSGLLMEGRSSRSQVETWLRDWAKRYDTLSAVKTTPKKRSERRRNAHKNRARNENGQYA